PNKKRSEITSDNNKPVVYIDDFEGAQRHISLGLATAQWIHSSPPVDSSIAEDGTARALYRGRTFWYQYFLPRVEIKEVYPNKDYLPGRSKLSPLFIDFTPHYRGIYNNNPEYQDSLTKEVYPEADLTFAERNKDKIWGGMTRLFSSFNTNFDTENIDYVEVMMKISKREPGNTKMFIDIGQISEDIIPNGELNTEDGSADNPMPNGIIDLGEDLGIDTLSTTLEKREENYPAPLYLEADPARDNYAFNFNKKDNDRTADDFIKYNNFEGNSTISEIGQFPDTEVLNKNNGQTISLDNSYFSYEVNLEPDPNRNPQIAGGNEDTGWFLYRIPIRKPNRKVGNPLFSNIQYIRVWFKGAPLKAAIADWRLVGSQWQRKNTFQANVSDEDSVMEVAFVSVEENSGAPDYYTKPPGVKAPRQYSNDQSKDLKLNEQSMAISVKNLRYGEERMAVRLFHPMDVFNYKEMKFFVHGDGSMPDQTVSGAVPKGYAFLRFGIDSANYYEYRRPLTRGWEECKIVLSQLTAIKQIRDTSGIRERQIFPVPGDPLAYFAVKGNPVLTRVQFYGVGIANPNERYPNELTTTMWIDVLRLIDPEASSDWAALGNVNLKLADLGSVNASFKHTKPNFHRLEDRFGDRINATEWSVNMVGNLDKFAPKSFRGMKIPITFTHSEMTQNPEFVANNDINLEDAAKAAYDDAINNNYSADEASVLANDVRKRSQTLRIMDSWALTGV
ncbi:MAG: cell surface protein SprA, partial [Chlorobi bacterium]|nr:cell surface protein SprA [Chlorobiota bacterium]